MLDDKRIFVVEKPEMDPVMIAEIGSVRSGQHFELFYDIIFDEMGWTLPDHLRPIAWALSDTNINLMMINFSPGSGKSFLMEVAYPLYEMGLNLNNTILAVSAGGDLPAFFLQTTMNTVEKNKQFHALFPAIIPDRDLGWSKTQGMFVKRTVTGQPSPTYLALGYTSSILTGQHARILIIDDLHNEENVQTADARDKIEDFFYRTLIGRGDPQGYRMLIVGRRWAADDLYGRLKKSADFLVMSLPAIRETKDLYYDVRIPAGLSCVFNNFQPNSQVEDIKVKYGENEQELGFFWKGSAAKYQEALLNKKNKPYIFEVEYQSNPESADARIFNPSDFVDFTLPEEMSIGRNYDIIASYIQHMNFEMIIQSWDTAFTAKTTNDPSVGMCYDPETEILTTRGWIFFKDLTELDLVATRHQDTHKFQWQKPSELIKQYFRGELIHFRAQALDLLVTPNHNMIVRKYGNANQKGRKSYERFMRADQVAKDFTYECIPITSCWDGTEIHEFNLPNSMIDRRDWPVKNLPLNKNFSGIIKVCPICNRKHYKQPCQSNQVYCSRECITASLSKPIHMSGDDYCAFMGMYLSEGSYSLGAINICQTKKGAGYFQYKDLLIKIFGKEPYYDLKRGWTIYSALLRDHVKIFGKSFEKFVPDLIKNATQNQINIFLYYYWLGDRSGPDRFAICTSSKRMADDIQELFQKTGYGSSLKSRNRIGKQSFCNSRLVTARHISYSVTKFRTKDSAVNYVKIKKVNKIPYQGFVYCATVTNHTLLVRRNGNIAWCGNTIGLKGCEKDHRSHEPQPLPVPFHYDVYVLDEIIKHLQMGDLLDEVNAYFNLWQPNYVLIENSASGIPIIQSLQSYSIQIIPVTVQHTSKVSRAIDGAKAGSTQGWAKLGRIKIPQNAQWSAGLLGELGDFTGARGKRDDQVDALVQACNFAIDFGVQTRDLPPGWRTDAEIDEKISTFAPNAHPLDELPHLYKNIPNPYNGLCATCKNYDMKTSFCKMLKVKMAKIATCPLYEPTKQADELRDY